MLVGTEECGSLAIKLPMKKKPNIWPHTSALQIALISVSALLIMVSEAPAQNQFDASWTRTGSMGTARYNHTATLLPSAKVLVAGGENFPDFFSSAELYDPASGTWTATGSMNIARYWHTATLLPSGKVLVAGGLGSTGYLSSADLYDPATGTWTATGNLVVPRTCACVQAASCVI